MLRVLGLLALGFLTGCVQANLELKVDWMGRVEQILTLTPEPGNPQGQEILQGWVGRLVGQGWTLEPQAGAIRARRALKGPGWGSGGLNLGTGAFTDERFSLTRHGGWLLETYRLEVNLGPPNPALGGFSPAGQVSSLASLALLPQLSLSLQTPLRANAHNADRVEGTTYTWRIHPMGAKTYHIEYRILRWDRVLLLVLALGLLGGWYRRAHPRR